MNKPTALAINITDERATLYRAMAARSRAVRLVQQPTDADAMICDDLDAVKIAVRSGQRVLLLDPFSIAQSDREQLAAMDTVTPALQWRFQPSTQQVKQAIDAGKLGDPGLLRIHSWNFDPTAGDQSLEQQLDLAIWLFGKPPTEVYGSQRPGYTQAHLGFGAGMALIDIDTAGAGENSYYSLSLIGSTGAVYADDHHNMNLIIDRGGTRTIGGGQDHVAIADMIDSFARRAASGEDFHADFQQINVVNEVAWRVAQSVSRGKVIAGGSHG